MVMTVGGGVTVRGKAPAAGHSAANFNKALASSQKFGLTESLLNAVIAAHISPEGKGKPVGGIPNTNPNPEKRSMTVMDAKTGQMVTAGDMEHVFSQQSMSKPTAMALAMELMGGEHAYRQYVGVEASGRPYNAKELLPDGRPFNSSVNTGALATWVLIHAHAPDGHDPFELYMNKMKEMTGNQNLEVNEAMAMGEYSFRPEGGGKSGNQEIMDVLDKAGLMQVLEKKNAGRPLSAEQKQEFMDKVFLDYCRACAVMVNTKDMANVAAVYRNGGVRVDGATGAETPVLPKAVADFVHRSNAVSGSYDESGTQFVKNDFAGKTGVDGGIFGSLLGKDNLVVATHHSDLNAAGNSGEGQKWIGQLNRMDVAFPQEPTPAAVFPADVNDTPITPPRAADGSALTELPAGSLRPSPRETDQRLRIEAGEETVGNIGERLQTVAGKHGNFYMKEPDGTKRKDPLLGARLLHAAPDTQSVWKKYYLAPGNHQLHKVVVVKDDRPKRQEQARLLSLSNLNPLSPSRSAAGTAVSQEGVQRGSNVHSATGAATQLLSAVRGRGGSTGVSGAARRSGGGAGLFSVLRRSGGS